MTYRTERQEVINAVPTPVEHRNHTENLPEGFMIVQDGNNFWPLYHKSESTERVRPGWFNFYVRHSTMKD